jgi:hypothetical protein
MALELDLFARAALGLDASRSIGGDGLDLRCLLP